MKKQQLVIFVGNIFLEHKRMETILSIKFKPFNTNYDYLFFSRSSVSDYNYILYTSYNIFIF